MWRVALCAMIQLCAVVWVGGCTSVCRFGVGHSCQHQHDCGARGHASQLVRSSLCLPRTEPPTPTQSLLLTNPSSLLHSSISQYSILISLGSPRPPARACLRRNAARQAHRCPFRGHQERGQQHVKRQRRTACASSTSRSRAAALAHPPNAPTHAAVTLGMPLDRTGAWQHPRPDRRTATSCRTHCRHAPREQQRDPQRLGRRTTVDTHGRLLWQRVENAALLHSLATHHACPAPQFDQRVGNYRGRSSRPNQRRAATCPPVHRRHMCL